MMKLKKMQENGTCFPAFCTKVYVCLTGSVFLLWPGLTGYTGIADSKSLVFYLLCGAYCAFLLFSTLFAVLGHGPSDGVRSRRLCSARLFLLLYITFSWVSAFLSPYGSSCILGISRGEGSLTITLYGLSALCIAGFWKSTAHTENGVLKDSRLSDRRNADGCRFLRYLFSLWKSGIMSCMDLIFCTGILLSSIAILQFTGSNPFHLFPEGYNYFGANRDYYGVYLSTIGNADFLAAVLCSISAMAAVTFLLPRGTVEWHFSPWRMTPLTAFLLSSAVLLWTSSAAGLAGLCTGLFFVLILACIHTENRLRYFHRSLLCGAILVFLFGFLVKDGILPDSLGSGRIYIWKEVWERIWEYPLFGHGPDTMSMDNIPPYGYVSYTGAWISYGGIDAAHNEFLNILYHQGLVGLLSYMLFLYFLIRGALTADFRKNRAIPVLLAGVASYLAQSFFSISTAANAPFFWLCAGLLLSESGGLTSDQ